MSRNTWEGLRKNRILEPQWIEVKLSEVEVELLGSRNSRVSFDQAYRSETYDDDVRKALDLALEGGRKPLTSTFAPRRKESSSSCCALR